jgi:hypothetical protein
MMAVSLEIQRNLSKISWKISARSADRSADHERHFGVSRVFDAVMQAISRINVMQRPLTRTQAEAAVYLNLSQDGTQDLLAAVMLHEFARDGAAPMCGDAHYQ